MEGGCGGGGYEGVQGVRVVGGAGFVVERGIFYNN